jgi:hypothetical protein
LRSAAGKVAHRKQVIIDAALDCFLQFGYDKTTLEDIATRAGLSRNPPLSSVQEQGGDLHRDNAFALP